MSISHNSFHISLHCRARRHQTYAIVTGILGALALPSAAWATMGHQGPLLQGQTRVSLKPSTSAAPPVTATLTGSNLRGTLGDGTNVDIESFRGPIISVCTEDGVSRSRQCVHKHPEDLVGLRWTEDVCMRDASCMPVHYRIASIDVDTSQNTMAVYSDNSDVWLYRVEHSALPTPTEDDWENACGVGDGDGLGLFVNGQWRVSGEQTPDGYTFSCDRGAIAKCVRQWGYKPWRSLPASADGQLVSLRPLHDACVRAARADYVGDGESHTREGVTIDMFDVHHFNVQTLDPGFTAESSFAEDGAVQLHRLRLAAHPLRRVFLPSSARQPLVHVWSAPPARHQPM